MLLVAVSYEEAWHRSNKSMTKLYTKLKSQQIFSQKTLRRKLQIFFTFFDETTKDKTQRIKTKRKEEVDISFLHFLCFLSLSSSQREKER